MTMVAATTTTSNTAGTSTTAKSAESKISSDFDTWMTLLTTQLQNQDPFDPVDSTQYTAQLAQFSAVEQQVRTNDLLTSLVSANTSSDMASMAEWIGKEVRLAASGSFEGEPITIYAKPNASAARAELVVRDAYGNEVDRFAINAGESEIDWDGSKSTGGTVPYGSYSFEVESFGAGGASLGASDAEIFAQVKEVRRSGNTLSLVLPDGTYVDAANISAVRAAQG